MFRNRYLCVALAAVMSLAIDISTTQAGLVWDALDDFSTTSNTSSDTWQYFFNDGSNPNTNYSLFPNYGEVSGTGGMVGWHRDLNGHFVGLNSITTPTELVLHPYIFPTTAGVAWKSPITGTVDIEFSLTDRGLDWGDGVTYRLYKSGVDTALSSGTVVNGGATGTISVDDVSVSSDDMLYLVVGPNGDPAWDSTGASFTISEIPEPSTALLFGSGLLSLVFVAWRRR
ncbi:MAG: PEP-CTERM sorting domain-containing protein [Pirellulales bacterium]|nr:PEP-CTERM sorting domain-containing protein [Pirellulales bacterium]